MTNLMNTDIDTNAQAEEEMLVIHLTVATAQNMNLKYDRITKTLLNSRKEDGTTVLSEDEVAELRGVLIRYRDCLNDAAKEIATMTTAYNRMVHESKKFTKKITKLFAK